MERWWNCVIEVTVPFDTPEDARNAFTGEGTINRLFEILRNNAVIGERIQEAMEPFTGTIASR